MSFWKPITILLRLRAAVARRAFERSPTAFLWALLLACALALVAFGMGRRVAAEWMLLPAGEAEAALRRLWLLTQAFWLLALLVPGGLALLGQTAPTPVLRAFALRPSQILLAETLAGLLDVPALLLLPLTLPLLGTLVAAGEIGQAVCVLLALALLALNTVLLARLLAHLGALCLRRFRRWAEIPALAVFVLFGLCIGAPPALASLTTSSRQSAPLVSLPSLSLPDFDGAPMLPAGLAGAAVASARSDRPGEAAAMLLGLMAYGGLTGYGGLLALRGINRAGSEDVGRDTIRPVRQATVCHVGATRAGPLAQLYALIATDIRLLLRRPQAYLPLRQPAALLLLGVFAFLSPDMSRNPLYNLKELLGIGALLYNLLWQIQLLCNRFGTEAGTGALLFGFSCPRHRLLLGKNLSLFLLLWLLDSAALLGLSYVAEAVSLLPLLLLWLPMILIVLTALGNLVSVAQPFAIARQAERARAEPPDTLASVYALVGVGTALLLTPIPTLLDRGAVGGFGAMLYLGLLYTASLALAGAILARREPLLITQLDGNP